jgi:uncharacterized protein (DUF1330 family)
VIVAQLNHPHPVQEVITSKGYVVFTLNVRDEARLFDYIQAATPTLLKAGGNLLVAGPAVLGAGR